MRVSNNKARDYVEKLEEFDGSNTTGRWVGDENLYVVYSYGSHFPMYVYDKEQSKWIGNKDKYSRSTTRHQSQLRPSSIALWVDIKEIQSIVWHGGLLGHTINKAQH
jgi:hypothetical protein